ncbi:MAG: hypothetical protein ABJA66_17045 [Actinomycetota bacterium]
MRFLKLTILAFFIAFSAACFLLSDKKLSIKNAPKNPQAFFTHHAQTFQKANPENIKGDFECENSFEFGAVKAAMTKNGADFFIAFETKGQKETYQIEAVVGTKKIEEYIARKDTKLLRLPIAYDLSQKRWINLSSAFFEADDKDFFKHQKDWNAECASCHLENASTNLENFDVKNLSSDEVLLACGACHAKGLTDSFPKFDEIVSKEKYSGAVILAHQNRAQNPADFFEDGSVRLAAHEYQGILRSVCFVKSKAGGQELGGEKINCLSCHSIENGNIDVKTDEKLLNFQACTNCHQQFSAPASIAEHTKHSTASQASSCYSCHMPEVVYGHLQFQKTHKISIPNPELTVQKSVPNACNLCHTDKSVNWAILQTKSLWTQHFRDAKTSSDTQFDEAEGIRGLFAGDALTRALTADALKKHGTPKWFAPFVLKAAQDENYSLVRYFLENALAENKNLPKPQDISPKTENQVSITAQKLRSRRKKNDLEIAE